MGGEMMSRYLFEFLSNRISFAFIMIFLMLFLDLRCSWLISVLTAVFAYLSEFMLGYMCYFTDFGKHHQVLFTAASILLIQGGRSCWAATGISARCSPPCPARALSCWGRRWERSRSSIRATP